ncbi:MAG TPA: hypothetical protein VFC72_00420 [Corynebacterium sp.]|nr:hypothetical protein [Corynebacterium sp.]
MDTTQNPNLTELVDATLDWVHYGEPNSTDLIELATLSFDLAARDLGFRGNDELIVSRTEFRRDGSAESCLVEITSRLVDSDTAPAGMSLRLGEKKREFSTHREGLTALYTWCASGQLA